MRDQILQRLIDHAEATAIRVEKCRIYCILLSTPKIISFTILSISIIQVLPIYNEIPSEYFKTSLSYVLIILSLVGLLFDMMSDLKRKYKESQMVYLDNMRIFDRTYNNLDKLSEEELEDISTMIDTTEKYYEADELPYYLIGDQTALNKFLKKKRTFDWIIQGNKNT